MNFYPLKFKDNLGQRIGFKKKITHTWQTVDVDACMVREGFICESNLLKARNKGSVTLKCTPATILNPSWYRQDKDACVFRTPCDNLTVDNTSSLPITQKQVFVTLLTQQDVFQLLPTRSCVTEPTCQLFSNISWNGRYPGQRTVGTSWPAQTATTAEEEKSEDTDQCPSQYGKGTSCGRTNEEGWSESLVGKLAWLVPNCHRLFQPKATSCSCDTGTSWDWVCVSNCSVCKSVVPNPAIKKMNSSRITEVEGRKSNVFVLPEPDAVFYFIDIAKF